MSGPIDGVLSRLEGYRLRSNGRDRWRACCPAHGGSNASALSVGVGDNGAVLLRCWHGCDAEAVTRALGLDMADLFPPSDAQAAPLKRRRLLPAHQALELLDNEMTIARLVLVDLARGETVDDATKERLMLGAARVTMLLDEVRA